MSADTAILTVSPPRVVTRRPLESGVQADSSELCSAPVVWEAEPSPARSWPSRLQIVGILAFIQSVLFLLLWLWICASAGAATPAKVDFNPNLKESSYNPVKQRDPFSKAGSPEVAGKAAAVSLPVFHLNGILYEPSNPAAIVDDTLLILNKSVTLTTGNGEVRVRAVEITRDRVVLVANGQKVELRANPAEPAVNAAR